jgi:hypothetical protein
LHKEHLMCPSFTRRQLLTTVAGGAFWNWAVRLLGCRAKPGGSHVAAAPVPTAGWPPVGAVSPVSYTTYYFDGRGGVSYYDFSGYLREVKGLETTVVTYDLEASAGHPEDASGTAPRLG